MHEKHGCRAIADRPFGPAGLQAIFHVLKKRLNDELGEISAQKQSGGPVLQLGLGRLQRGEQSNSRD